MDNINFVKIMQGALKAGEITGATNMCDSVTNMIVQLKKSLESQKIDLDLPESAHACEWISCTERSPEIDEHVLILRENMNVAEIGYLNSTEDWKSRCDLDDNHDHCDIYDVLFWCRIPKFPQASDNSLQSRAVRINEVMKRRQQ